MKKLNATFVRLDLSSRDVAEFNREHILKSRWSKEFIIKDHFEMFFSFLFMLLFVILYMNHWLRGSLMETLKFIFANELSYPVYFLIYSLINIQVIISSMEVKGYAYSTVP